MSGLAFKVAVGGALAWCGLVAIEMNATGASAAAFGFGSMSGTLIAGLALFMALGEARSFATGAAAGLTAAFCSGPFLQFCLAFAAPTNAMMIAYCAAAAAAGGLILAMRLPATAMIGGALAQLFGVLVLARLQFGIDGSMIEESKSLLGPAAAAWCIAMGLALRFRRAAGAA